MPALSDEAILRRAWELFHLFNACYVKACEGQDAERLVSEHVAVRIAVLALMRHVLSEGDDRPGGPIAVAGNTLYAALRGQPLPAGYT